MPHKIGDIVTWSKRGIKRKYIKVMEGKKTENFVQYSRWLIENSGRKLNKGEVVHHINGDFLDDRLENLEVLTVSEHARKHREIDGISEACRIGHKKKFRKQRNALLPKVFRFYKQGKSLRKMAKELNLHRNTIKKILVENDYNKK